MKNWTVDDVMTAKVVSVDVGASYRSVVDTLIENRVSAVPVVDPFLRVGGDGRRVVQAIPMPGDDGLHGAAAGVRLTERPFEGAASSVRSVHPHDDQMPGVHGVSFRQVHGARRRGAPSGPEVTGEEGNGPNGPAVRTEPLIASALRGGT